MKCRAGQGRAGQGRAGPALTDKSAVMTAGTLQYGCTINQARRSTAAVLYLNDACVVQDVGSSYCGRCEHDTTIVIRHNSVHAIS